MTIPKPTVTSANAQRTFACSGAAVTGLIVNEQEEILLLSSPTKHNQLWIPISGAFEDGETVLEGVLRETREEAGAAVQVRPLGTVHTATFHYDEHVPYVISIYYLLAYEGGQVQPGDDMQGSQYRWWDLEAIAREQPKLFFPPDRYWILERAVELYRLWKDAPAVQLESLRG